MTLTAKGRATRERLLAAAGEQLAAEGRIEVATVAAAAGVAQSVLYRYFEGKDGLVAAVVHGFYDEYDAEVFGVELPGDSWFARETLRLRQEVAFLYRHPLGRVVAAGLLHEAAAARADAERVRRQAQDAARNIRRGQRSGEIPRAVDAGLAGAAIIGALRAMLADALARPKPPPERRVADAAAAVGRALLQPD